MSVAQTTDGNAKLYAFENLPVALIFQYAVVKGQFGAAPTLELRCLRGGFPSSNLAIVMRSA